MPSGRFPSKFEEYKTLRESGKTPEEIIESGVMSRSTVSRHERKISGTTIDVPAAPDGIRSEPFDAKKKDRKAQPRSRSTKNAPITEHTAGLILKGCSEIVAFLAAESELALDDEEVDILEAPLTESLALLPGDIAKGINKYAAPGVFLSQFIAIYARKMQRIAMKRAGLIQGRNPARPGTAPPPSAAPQSPAADQQRAYYESNLEAVKAAAAAVAATNGVARNAGPAPETSTGTLEEEDRKTEFET